MALSRAQISALRDLRLKKHRETQGRFVIENPKVVAELLSAGQPFDTIYATPDWTPPPGIEITPVSPAEMARISHYPTPSCVLAVGAIRRHILAADTLNHGLTLVLDGIQDPGNVGTLLRIADWFGLDRVLLSPDCADLFSQKVINASMGSFTHIPTFSADPAPALAAASVPVFGCDLRGDPLSALAAPPRDAAIVIGSEGRGLSAPVAATINHRLTIPRHGEAESLNAAVAAGIVCHHFRG